jgi:hypothetical protein
MKAPKTSRIFLCLTEPQAFWLLLLLESTLAAADPSKATRSYAAVLRKIDKVSRGKSRRAAA